MNNGYSSQFITAISQVPLISFSIPSYLWSTVTGIRRTDLASLLTSPWSGRRRAMSSPSLCPQGCWCWSATSPSALRTPSWTWWWMLTQQSSWSSQHSEMKLHLCHSVHTICFSFMGISTLLPATGYIKMIDIWMIFTMAYPFFIITLHCLQEVVFLLFNIHF